MKDKIDIGSRGRSSNKQLNQFVKYMKSKFRVAHVQRFTILLTLAFSSKIADQFHSQN